MGTLPESRLLNIKTALAVGEVVVSGCEEVVTSWQTGLSHPVQPSRQNSSQGQSEIFIYSSEIIIIRRLNSGDLGIF